MKKSQLDKISMLEPGAGSGFLSIWAGRQGAIVTATDISTIALSAIEKNARANDVELTIIQSDLFENIKGTFDLIVVNPPYYRKNPALEGDHAWYAGEEYQYFQRFFAGVTKHMSPLGNILMVLSESCDIQFICDEANRAGMYSRIIKKSEFFLETHYVFSFSFL